MQHDKTFSIFKAIGILLILVGHSALKTPLFTFTYLFHIPIFFFVAGYFFKDAYVEKPWTFLSKKLLRLYVPWLAYGILFVLLHNLFLKYQWIAYDFHAQRAIEPYDAHDILQKMGGVLTFFAWKEPLLAPLWFLFGLFSGLCVFFGITWLSIRCSPRHPERCRALLSTVVMAIGFLGNAYHWHFSLIYRPFVIAGLMYTGVLYRLFEHKLRPKALYAALCLLVLIVATHFKYQVNVGGMLFGNPLLFLCFAVAGIYLVLWTAQVVNERTVLLRRWLDLVGQYTFTIMALQYLAFKLVMVLQIAIYDFPSRYLAYYPVIPKKTALWWPAYTLVGLLVPLFVGYAANYLTLRFKKKVG